MTMSLNASASGDAQNALFLAHACELAYFAESEASPRFQSELGLDSQADQRRQHASLRCGEQ